MGAAIRQCCLYPWIPLSSPLAYPIPAEEGNEKPESYREDCKRQAGQKPAVRQTLAPMQSCWSRHRLSLSELVTSFWSIWELSFLAVTPEELPDKNLCLIFQRKWSKGWRDGSVLKSNGCSSRGAPSASQHPYGGSQGTLTLVPGDMTVSSGLHRLQAHMWYTDTQGYNMNTHKN